MKLNFLQNEINDLALKGIKRSLKRLDSAQERLIVVNGKTLLNFCSNDYLGLANNLQIKEAMSSALGVFGVGSGASRLVCGNMSPHEVLEEKLAVFKKTAAALVYSTGYMANVGIISALMGRHGVVLSDKLNHASIIDGIILSRAKLYRYAHGDMESLENFLKKIPVTTPKLIATDSVFSMDGDRAPLNRIAELAKRYEAILMVDEAHAFGVLGQQGGGLVEELGLEGKVDIQMGTLSKAAGLLGGFACGSEALRSYLINKSRSFIYSTAMPPAIASAAIISLGIIQQGQALRLELQTNADLLRIKLKSMGFDTMHSSTPIIPILVKDPHQALLMSERLWQEGIFVQAIRPPTVPEGAARLRLTLTALHTSDDINFLLNALRKL